jgi:iron(III) transport system substrate-binding protein
VQQELKNNAVQCDVFSTSDIAHMPALKARGALAHYAPPTASGIAPAFQSYADPGFYYPEGATLTLITCNTQAVKPEDRPKALTDLLDPRWKGRIALAHPAFSGCMGVWCTAVRKRYGWDFFEKLAKNNPRIGRSLNDTITMLNAGECAIGVSPSSTSLASAEKGNPIGLIYPTDGCSPCIGPSAVLAAAPHPNAARLFMDWLLGPGFGQMFADAGGVSVRTDVRPKQDARPIQEVPLLPLTVAEIGKGVPEVIEQWRDTFGN